MRAERVGGLEAVVAGGTDRQGGGQGPAIVLLHGFGASGMDLVGLYRMLDVPREIRFVFPAAPVVLAPGPAGYDSRCWWPLDVAALDRAVRTGRPRDLSSEHPAELAERVPMLGAALDEIEARLEVPAGKLLLGGFSQGSMLALALALHSDRPLAGLALLSSALLAADQWVPRMASRRGLPVLQSHGTEDVLLSYPAAEILCARMREAGMDVEFVSFRGGHEIPQRVLDSLGALARRVL